MNKIDELETQQESKRKELVYFPTRAELVS